MSKQPSPWDPPPSGGGRWLPWLIMMAVVLGLVGLLLWRYPQALYGHEDWSRLIYLLLLFVLISGGFFGARRLNIGKAARYAAIWLGIGLVLMLGYSYRQELQTIGQRLLGEVVPHQGTPAGARALSFRADQSGHFSIEAWVNGTPVRFLVDTGATAIVLTRADAERIGIDPAALSFTRFAHTANGIVRTAPIRLGDLAIGGLRLEGLPAMVNEGELGQSLLGMAFLDRLRSYEVRDGVLTLRW
ncbi:MAG: TIGR02281 family clan AA aspartic protease [Alphaproteobacteria bacterium]|jgi:aspartyl protease family protein|nr:TIGR02281 family clan AA aspartic protease [Alphaproteobacteria bacterium]MDP6566781.1 TIGR02281 family clan AA aspartic protease [Alphaproteobacteria bacterium]MDP6812281.1 TIGR02281 family clan AA aspartic protease [Alphaproteobacteria bacterium]